MAENKNMKVDDEIMKNAAGGTDESAPEPRFHVGDRVIVRGQEDHDSVIKQVHYTGSVGANAWQYLVHMVHHSTGLIADAYIFESNLSPYGSPDQ